MSIRENWEKVDVPSFVSAWLEERRAGGNDSDDSFDMKATLMSFTASPEVQWKFICSAVEQSKSDDELGTIAAGPFESLMGKDGPTYIDQLEQVCRTNPKFARMTTGAWQHTMSEEVWARVRAIQSSASPLGD